MSGVSVPFMTSVLDSYNGFKGVKQLVDVGGSAGDCLRMILQKHRFIYEGINFDVPEVVGEAPSILGVTHIGGDTFKSIPAADAIFMKWVLTTWTDDEYKLIMENCYKALPAGGKLIACKPVLLDDSNESQRTRALLEWDIFVMTIYRAKVVLDGPPLPKLLHYLGRFRIPLTRLAAFADFSTSLFLHEFCSGAHMRRTHGETCGRIAGSLSPKANEVETPEFPNEANALPEFSRTPGIKTFHKDGFHDFGSARLDGENTWSVVSKEAKALVHLNENALCSSSSQPTCKANKSGKGTL
ncbi:hypothetical protein WN943_001658 [Citrus x changshan-huyou]